jgi:hypothetical protein
MTTHKTLDALRVAMQAEFGCNFILEPGCQGLPGRRGLDWMLLDATGHLLLRAHNKATLLHHMESFRIGMRSGMIEAAYVRGIAPMFKEIAAMAEAETTDPAARFWAISQLARASLARLNGSPAL